MEHTYDVDFEKYIIFHRGIAEVRVTDDGHLHVYYQDGTDKDMGDIAGGNLDRAEELYNQSSTLVDSVQEKLSSIETAMDNAESTVEEMEGVQGRANAIIQELTEKTQTITTEVDNYFRDIDGVEWDELQSKWYVDLSNYYVKDETVAHINAGIENIDGVEAREVTERDENDNEITTTEYYVDLDTENIQNFIAGKVQENIALVDGIVKNASEGENALKVDYPFSSIPNSKIDAIFTMTGEEEEEETDGE